MFSFGSLHTLLSHHHSLQKALGDKQIFFVGGAIRDLLLGLTTDPLDLDITTKTHPETLWNNRPTDDSRSCFRTEKFGTFTLIPKDPKVGNPQAQYEITPFREEGGYLDFRHPEEIARSESLLADSKRRDFTINALYTLIRTQSLIKDDLQGESISKEQILSACNEYGGVILQNESILILQDHALIDSLFKEGLLKKDILKKLVTRLPCVKSSTHSSPDALIILFDPQQGLQDMYTKTLRTVGDPHQRFAEDALRILRGVRFVNILNQKLGTQPQSQDTRLFDFENTTRDAMKKNYYLVKHLAKERLHQEIMKVFSGNNPFGYVSLLDELHLTHLLFPSLSSLKHLEQPVRYHPFDVRTHTLLTLHAIQNINASPLVKFAMLYHDVGKSEQYYFYSLGISKEEKKLPVSGHMYHTYLGEELADADMEQLGFSKKERQEVCWYIAKHHRPQELLDGKTDNREKKIRKMISEVGIERVCNLFDIAKADRCGQFNPIQPPSTEEIDTLKHIAETIYAQEGRFTIKQLAVSGNDIMETFQLQPGPQVGELLDRAFQRVIENIHNRNTKQKIITYLNQKK